MSEAQALDVVWKPLDLVALYGRTGGTPLGQRPQARQAYRLADIARQAKRRGLPIHAQPAHFPTNAAPASYAIIAAQKAVQKAGDQTGSGDMFALVEAVLAACWAEEKNIAEDAVVKAALAAAGFDPGLADSGLFTGAEVYGRNLEEAVQAGVFGAPSFVTEDGALFWGQDRLDDLADHLAGLQAGLPEGAG